MLEIDELNAYLHDSHEWNAFMLLPAAFRQELTDLSTSKNSSQKTFAALITCQVRSRQLARLLNDRLCIFVPKAAERWRWTDEAQIAEVGDLSTIVSLYGLPYAEYLAKIKAQRTFLETHEILR